MIIFFITVSVIISLNYINFYKRTVSNPREIKFIHWRK